MGHEDATGVCDKKLVRKDTKIKTFVNNSLFADEDAVYCMMDYFDNIGDLGKNKEYLKDEFVVKECLKIRWLTDCLDLQDNIIRNILVNRDGELLSIDEGDIYGKRLVYLINMNGFHQRIFQMKILNEVLDDILSEKDMKIKYVNKENA